MPKRHTTTSDPFASMRTFLHRQNHAPPNKQGRRSYFGGDAGFTLLEVLIAAVVLMIGLMGLFGLLDISVKAGASTRAREGATSPAREIVEDARTIPYAQLSPTSTEGQLQAMNGL